MLTRPMIVKSDPFEAGVDVLIAHHLELMRAACPPESVHALEPAELAGANVEFYTMREDKTIIGMVALKIHPKLGGEIKSMHIIEAARGRGFSRQLTTFLIQRANALALPALWLETGIEPKFGAARALYEKFGFQICPPFANYKSDPNSIFMRLDLGT